MALNGHCVSRSAITPAEAESCSHKGPVIDRRQVVGNLAGIRAMDPAFGMTAVSIHPKRRDQAQIMGYRSVDVSTVVMTNHSHLIQLYAHELLGCEEVQ